MVRIVQATLYIVGAGLVVGGIINIFSKEDLGAPPSSNISIPPAILIGGVSMTIPFLLKPAKQNNLKKAIQVYN